MGWLFGSKTPEQQLNAVKTDHLPANLQPNKPDLSNSGGLSALGDIGELSKKLDAQNQVNGKAAANPEIPSAKDQYRHQADALARAAEHARVLEKSSKSQEIFELSRMEETTKQKQQEAQIERYKLQIKQAEGEAIRIKGEEDRKTMAREVKFGGQVAIIL